MPHRIPVSCSPAWEPRACLAGRPRPRSQPRALPRADADRLERRIQELGRFGANPEGGVSRVAFSAADIAGREYVKSLMRDAGLDVRVDAAGNIIGRRAGTDPSLPVIMTGSHIDSVPKGGNYDGDVGVLGAIEVAELLRAHGIATRHPFEFVVFTDEEGGTVGSQAMAGRLGASAFDVVSHSGLTIGDGIRAVGGDPARTRGGATHTRVGRRVRRASHRAGRDPRRVRHRHRRRRGHRRHPLVGRHRRGRREPRRHHADESQARRARDRRRTHARREPHRLDDAGHAGRDRRPDQTRSRAPRTSFPAASR